MNGTLKQVTSRDAGFENLIVEELLIISGTVIVDKQDHSLRLFQWVTLGIVLLTVVTRLPSLLHPQPIFNEAIYSVVANRLSMAAGLTSMRSSASRRCFFGPTRQFSKWRESIIGRRCTWPRLSGAGHDGGLYAIGKASFDRETGLIAALLYSIFQPWVPGLNLAFNGELLMNLPIVWGWAIAFRPSSRARGPSWFFRAHFFAQDFYLNNPRRLRRFHSESICCCRTIARAEA